MPSKKCSRCNETKDYNQFYTRSGGRPTSACKKCLNSARLDSFRQRKIDIINELGNKCSHCGGVFPYYVYEIHHPDGDGQILGRMDYLKGCSWLDVKLFLKDKKLELLCKNCHIIHHHK